MTGSKPQTLMNSLEDLLPLPSYLTAERKDRLKKSLMQFTGQDIAHKNYTDFYSSHIHKIFLQGDLIREFRFSSFNFNTGLYEKIYMDAIIISNTCDFDPNNSSSLRRNVLIAPIIPLEEYIKELQGEGVEDIKNKVAQIKKQLYSNLLYLPVTNDRVEYIAILDIIQEITKDELNNLLTKIPDSRIETLDYFGYYLFVLKLSYHLCRLPEDKYRE